MAKELFPYRLCKMEPLVLFVITSHSVCMQIILCVVEHMIPGVGINLVITGLVLQIITWIVGN